MDVFKPANNYYHQFARRTQKHIFFVTGLRIYELEILNRKEREDFTLRSQRRFADFAPPQRPWRLKK
ncbi:MAG: hypothetical protein Kow00127_24700 [Bacteroidales bacterium]